jgi:hypothetical protein
MINININRKGNSKYLMHRSISLDAVNELTDIDYITEEVYSLLNNVMMDDYNGEFEIEINGIVIHPECCVCHERSEDVRSVSGANVCGECIESEEVKDIVESIDVDRRWKEQQESVR